MNKTKIKLLPFLIILIGLSLYFYQIEQVEIEQLKYTGSVEGTEINLATELQGELIAMYFSEGQKIEVGDALFEIDVTDYDIQVKQLKIQQNIARLKYEQLLGGASEEEINQARSNKNSVAKQLSGTELNYRHTQDVYEDLKILHESGAVSKSDLDLAKLQMDQAYTSMRGMKSQLAASSAMLDKVLSGVDEEVIAIAKAEMALRALEIENLENTIKKGRKESPVSGLVQTINYNVGEYMIPGKTIVSVINLEGLTIDVYVREKNLYEVTVGDDVIITEGFLEGKDVSGKIVAISSNAEFTPKNVESKESKQEMVFKTTIEVIRGREYLKPGMFVDVEIVGK